MRCGRVIRTVKVHTMADHKFKIGQTVLFRRSAAEEALIPNARFVPLAPSSAPVVAGAVMPSTAPQQ